MPKRIDKAITSADIANMLGISQPTVSRILSGDTKYQVSEKTRRLIFSTAEQLGYRPNALARGLRNHTTSVIGFYTLPNVLDTRQEFFGDLYGGMQKSCETYHVDVLVHKTFEGRTSEAIYGEMIDGRTDGGLVYINPNSDLVPLLQKSRLPFVALADILPQIPSIGCQDADGIRQLMEYLWGKGHRRFAYISPRHEATTVTRRIETFHQFLKQQGCESGENPVIYIDDHFSKTALDFLEGMVERPTAVCCWNDRTAYDLLRHCLARGIRVPDELAVVGFDGFVDTKLPVLDLVTVRVPWYEMAKTAVSLLMDRIGGNEILLETLLPVEFVAGNSA